VLLTLVLTSQIVPAQTDTVAARSSSQPTYSAQDADSNAHSFTPSKSPLFAVGLSALLPGAGQLYNESYWKIPIVAGLGGYFVYEWIHNDNLAQDYRDQYDASKTADNPLGDTGLLSVRDFYKDQRDTFLWYFVILYVANVVDAYVDANLYDFDVGDDLTVRVMPEVKILDGGVAAVRIRMEW
jgi:hypothetical protein